MTNLLFLFFYKLNQKIKKFFHHFFLFPLLRFFQLILYHHLSKLLRQLNKMLTNNHWLILEGLRWIERATYASIMIGENTPPEIFAYVPLFPMALIGGLILQLIAKALASPTSSTRR